MADSFIKQLPAYITHFLIVQRWNGLSGHLGLSYECVQEGTGNQFKGSVEMIKQQMVVETDEL